MKKSFVSPSFLKQKARQIKKEKSLSQSKALDEASKLFGYSNYKNYLNDIKTKPSAPEAATEGDMHALWLDKKNEMSKKLLVVEPLFENFQIPFKDLLNSLKQVENSEESIQSVCKKSVLKEYLELYFLKDSLQDEGGDLDDYAPYHIAKSVSLENLTYKFNEDSIYVEGEYELKLQFGFDYDKGDKHPVFEDEEMFGSFELTIDRDKKITIENQDIGYPFR